MLIISLLDRIVRHTFVVYNWFVITLASLTLNIIDINDNAPVFKNIDTMSVIENQLHGQFISTIAATDDDGPLYNQISYFIEWVLFYLIFTEYELFTILSFRKLLRKIFFLITDLSIIQRVT